MFTPEDLLSAPRRSAAVPNKAGTHALYHVSSYSFESHSSSSSWNLVDLTNGESSVLFDDPSVQDVIWLGTDNESIMYINGTNSDVKGGSELWIAKSSDPKDGYKAASLPAALSNLKAVVTSPGKNINFIATALSYPDGAIYNPETAPKKYTSGLVYDSLFVRHWDKYVQPQTSALFAGSLSLEDGKYTFGSSKLRNLLVGKEKLETPVAPFGGSDDFDISKDGHFVVFLSKDPSLNLATNTVSYIYCVPFNGSSPPVAVNLSARNRLAKGASSSPVFSPDGRVAYLQMRRNGYESDQNKLYVAEGSDITSLAISWDVSPGSITWSSDGKSLYLTAESNGRERLYVISSAASSEDNPQELLGQGSVRSVSVLPNKKLLLSTNSLVSSTGFSILDTTTHSITPILSPAKIDPQLSSLRQSQVEDFSFPGAKGFPVHGFIVKPSDFDEAKQGGYPMAFFIHGGPQGAWTDSWSTRWNPAVFAGRGYVVVSVNPTGSTGYGQQFTDDIQGQWGGLPYQDLENAMSHLATSKEFSYIDLDRAVALGASYGGYMINYIQGMPLGRKFKALVCHDGVFSTLNQYTSEELYFPKHDFEGTPWQNRINYEKWDPAQPEKIKNWATPQMIIHNDLDYRLPVSEGLAAFNVLQELGIPSRFLTFVDENHWVLKPENSLLWHNEVLAWIDRWTDPAATAAAVATTTTTMVVGETLGNGVKMENGGGEL